MGGLVGRPLYVFKLDEFRMLDARLYVASLVESAG